MFTGIIQELGVLQNITSETVEVRAVAVLGDIALGDSIAVDGVCLTVVAYDASSFKASISLETLSRTTLGDKTQGAQVNLESALRVGGKLGGHFVTGHIDGLGYLVANEQTGNSWELTFESKTLQRYIVSKGSIAVNGVSLTVARCAEDGSWFTVAVVPHSWEETNLAQLTPGTPVNLEGDVLGKYVEKFMGLASGNQSAKSELSLEFLVEHGY
jgi:riboflavin synthase